MRKTIIVAAAFAGLSLAAAGAQASDETILKSCEQDLQLSDSGCQCVLEKVHSTLNENQHAFFLAAITNDRAAQQQAMMKLSGQEMMDLTNFMAQTPTQCQNQ